MVGVQGPIGADDELNALLFRLRGYMHTVLLFRTHLKEAEAISTWSRVLRSD